MSLPTEKIAGPKCFNWKSKPSLFCPGCGQSLFLKHLGFVIDKLNIADRVTLFIDIGCSLLSWNFYDFDTVQTHHGRSVPTAVGYKIANEKRIVIAIMGDGGGYSIGLQSLLHAAFRNSAITSFLMNNTEYSMTGGQMAPTSLKGEITSTSPEGKDTERFGSAFHGPELVSRLVKDSAFVARGSVSNPLLLEQMIEKSLLSQMKNNSFSFLETLSLCPTNWKTNAKESFEFLKKMEAEYPLGVMVKNENKGK